MKKLLLSLFSLIFMSSCLPSSGPAADIFFSSVTPSNADNKAHIPNELNSDLPDARKIDPKKIITLVKPLEEVLFPPGEGLMAQPHRATFDTIKSHILQNAYIKSFGHQADALASLLACLYSELVFKPANTTGTWFHSVEPSCCTCIPTEYRIAQALFTVLLIKEKYDSYADKDIALNYVSIASGHLKQDYITLSALIKLGVPHMQIAIIDPEYDFLKLAELRLLSSAFKGNREHYKAKQKDNMNGTVDYFKILLQQVTQAYQYANPSATPSTLSIMPYESTEEYLLTIKHNPLAQPHIAVLSDSAGQVKMHKRIWEDFRKITAIINKANSIISILDHSLEDTLFIDITKDDTSIVKLKEQDMQTPQPRVKPPVPAPRTKPTPVPAPRPKVKPPIPPNKPQLKTKPTPIPQTQLKGTTQTVESIIKMIDDGVIDLEDAVNQFFTTPLKKMQFREHYHRRNH